MQMGDLPRRRLLWAMLRYQRPWRELHWLSLMPGTEVTAVGESAPREDVDFIRRGYRQPIRRFVEAGAFAWLRDVRSLPGEYDWMASLELCSLVTGQISALADRRGSKQAVMVWGNIPDSPLYSIPPYRFALDRARGADLFLCLVESARQHCLVLGLPPERCHTVHPGIDLERFRPPTTPVRDPIVTYISPLAANKGIDRVLDAFAIVRRALPEARLRVAGRGPLAPLVQAAAAREGSGVEMLGGLDADGVAGALREAAVFVTAPRATRVWNEQFGLAYVEAMASGLPVVTTICGSNDEAVVPPNVRVEDDAEALASALLRFLTDAGMRDQVGAFNRRHVTAHHDLRRQAARMGEVFAAMERAG
jgi:phosphatidylinositol alpha-1,6-mannosyltransferase